MRTSNTPTISGHTKRKCASIRRHDPIVIISQGGELALRDALVRDEVATMHACLMDFLLATRSWIIPHVKVDYTLSWEEAIRAGVMAACPQRASGSISKRVMHALLDLDTQSDEPESGPVAIVQINRTNHRTVPYMKSVWEAVGLKAACARTLFATPRHVYDTSTWKVVPELHSIHRQFHLCSPILFGNGGATPDNFLNIRFDTMVSLPQSAPKHCLVARNCSSYLSLLRLAKGVIPQHDE